MSDFDLYVGMYCPLPRQRYGGVAVVCIPGWPLGPSALTDDAFMALGALYRLT